MPSCTSLRRRLPMTASVHGRSSVYRSSSGASRGRGVFLCPAVPPRRAWAPCHRPSQHRPPRLSSMSRARHPGPSRWSVQPVRPSRRSPPATTATAAASPPPPPAPEPPPPAAAAGLQARVSGQLRGTVDVPPPGSPPGAPLGAPPPEGDRPPTVNRRPSGVPAPDGGPAPGSWFSRVTDPSSGPSRPGHRSAAHHRHRRRSPPAPASGVRGVAAAVDGGRILHAAHGSTVAFLAYSSRTSSDWRWRSSISLTMASTFTELPTTDQLGFQRDVPGVDGQMFEFRRSCVSRGPWRPNRQADPRQPTDW